MVRLMDCGALVVMPSPGHESPIVVTFDGRPLRTLQDPLPRGGVRVPFPACGVHVVSVRWGDYDDTKTLALGPGLEVRAYSFWGWGPVPAPRTACITVEPPTFGWRCGTRTLPPDAPFDLGRCYGAGAVSGSEKVLHAEAKAQAPLSLTLVPTLDGHYTASVRDGAIVVAWEAETTACATMERPSGPSFPAVAPSSPVRPGTAAESAPPAPPASPPAP